MSKVNYVQFHIGDFLSGVMHMDSSEVGAYTMLIMAHYQAGEEGLPDDDKRLRRITKTNPKVWKRIKETVLEKFNLKDGRWTHKRVIEEINSIRKKAGPGRPKAEEGNPKQSLEKPIKDSQLENKLLKNNDSQKTNHKPITNNQYKKNIIKKPENVSEQIWGDFVIHRKNKKAVITQTVIDNIIRESQKANWTLEEALKEMISRNWTGFKSGWVESKKPKVLDAMECEI